MALSWCPGTVTQKKVWAEGLFTLHVQVAGIKEFIPGQFLQIGYQNGDEHIHRPYSVASPWGQEIEFFIVRVDGGQLTPWLWELEPGASLDINHRAAGSFTLEKTPDADVLWLVGTGTGLAPYVAMLRTQTPWERYKKIVVVHGVRFAKDFAYTDEFEELGKRHGGKFCYVPTLTRESCAGALQGRITSLLESGELESAAGTRIHADHSAIMLCGNPAMLDEMESLLEARHMKRHRSKSPGHIVLERYW